MGANLHNFPGYSSQHIYERAFVRTVLHLRGISRGATEREVEEARTTLRHYELGAARAVSSPASPYGKWRGRLAEPAAVEQAFMFVRFNSVLPPNATQLKAMNDWLAAGRPG